MVTTPNPPPHVLPEGRPLSVLVVEDDHTFADTLDHMLGKMDLKIKVAHADTGRDALAELIQERFDVVLLDLRLPDGDGLDVMERVIQAPLAPPAVIVITGAAPRERLYEALARGAQEFAEKDTLVERGDDYLCALIMRALYRQYGFRVRYLSLSKFIHVGTVPHSHSTEKGIEHA